MGWALGGPYLSALASSGLAVTSRRTERIWRCFLKPKEESLFLLCTSREPSLPGKAERTSSRTTPLPLGFCQGAAPACRGARPGMCLSPLFPLQLKACQQGEDRPGALPEVGGSLGAKVRRTGGSWTESFGAWAGKSKWGSCDLGAVTSAPAGDLAFLTPGLGAKPAEPGRPLSHTHSQHLERDLSYPPVSPPLLLQSRSSSQPTQPSTLPPAGSLCPPCPGPEGVPEAMGMCGRLGVGPLHNRVEMATNTATATRSPQGGARTRAGARGALPGPS